MPEVVIVGAGFAGLALALFLQNHGINSEVYELRDEAYTSGGTITLAPNALRVLSHLGLYAKLYTKGYSHDILTIVNPRGQTIATTPNIGQKTYNFSALRITRKILIDVLRDELKRRSIIIHYNKQCTGVIREGFESVTASFADGDTATALFAIGADGMRSRLREHVASGSSETQPRYTGQTQITGRISRKDIEDVETSFPLPAIFFCRSGTFGIMPYSFDGDELGFGIALTLQDRSREEWKDFSTDKKGIKDLLMANYVDGEANKLNHELLRTILKISKIDDLMVWQYSSSPDIDHWYSKDDHCRVFVLGDAAHGTPPSGQGAGMALEDAETLAWTLAEVLKPISSGGTQAVGEGKRRLRRLAQVWDTHRRERVQKVLGSALSAGALRKTTSSWFQQMMKEWAIWIGGYLIGKFKDNSLIYGYDGESIRSVLA